jgi:hypothetical protein
MPRRKRMEGDSQVHVTQYQWKKRVTTVNCTLLSKVKGMSTAVINSKQ